jgi:F-type H+-transporting ATPase subunit epsilon
MPSTFQCTLVTPQEEVLDRPIVYASIPAWDGQVGLAPQRAPLLVKLGDGHLRLDEEEGSSSHFFVGGGFAQMKDNRLTLLTDEAVAAKALDREEVEAAYKEALARRALDEKSATDRQRQLYRARAMRRILSARGA